MRFSARQQQMSFSVAYWNVFWEYRRHESSSELPLVDRIFEVSNLIFCRREEAGFSYGVDTFEELEVVLME